MFRDLKTLFLAGYEPGIFRSEGVRDDHYATPPGLLKFFIIVLIIAKLS
jgi:hypothetical protein